MDFADIKIIEADGYADDVDDGVDRPDLVKMNPFDGNPVHRPFRLGQTAEDPLGPLPDGSGKGTRIDHGHDITIMTVWLVVCNCDIKTETPHPLAQTFLRFEPVAPPRQGELCQFASQVLQRQAEIKEGGNGHVAGDPGGAVEVEGFHRSPLLVATPGIRSK